MVSVHWAPVLWHTNTGARLEEDLTDGVEEAVTGEGGLHHKPRGGSIGTNAAVGPGEVADECVVVFLVEKARGIGFRQFAAVDMCGNLDIVDTVEGDCWIVASRRSYDGHPAVDADICRALVAHEQEAVADRHMTAHSPGEGGVGNAGSLVVESRHRGAVDYN